MAAIHVLDPAPRGSAYLAHARFHALGAVNLTRPMATQDASANAGRDECFATNASVRSRVWRTSLGDISIVRVNGAHSRSSGSQRDAADALRMVSSR